MGILRVQGPLTGQAALLYWIPSVATSLFLVAERWDREDEDGEEGNEWGSHGSGIGIA